MALTPTQLNRLKELLAQRKTTFDKGLPGPELRQQIKERDPTLTNEQITQEVLRVRKEEAGPLVTPEQLKLGGVGGTVARFAGPAGIIKRAGFGLSQVLFPEQRRLIKSIEARGFGESAETLRTGGVTGLQAVGSLALTGLTLATAGGLGLAAKGAGLGARAARLGALGAGFGATGQLAEEGRITPGRVIAGAALGAVLPAALPALRRFIIRPIAGIPKTVSNLFFGPQGTTGFGVRFNDPQLSGFLNTVRRKPVGKPVADLGDLVTAGFGKVKQQANATFRIAEENVINKPLNRNEVIGGANNIVKDFLRISNVSKSAIANSGIDTPEIRAIQRAVTVLNSVKRPDTKNIINTKRTVSNLFRGTKNTAKSDAIITRLNSHLNNAIESVDPAFRNASRLWGANKSFLDKIKVNLIGTSKLNVDQTTAKLFQLAKDIDNPLKREGAETLLLELGKRTGVNYAKLFRALATAERLNPQAAQGLRAGVTREVVRILQVGISEVAGKAGEVAAKAGRIRGVLPSRITPRLPAVSPKIRRAAQIATQLGAFQTVK